ncbi:protein tyrosine/serine phosphatase-like protein [Ketogulonicigenium robustum]|uniref:Protein tyrosine/serine phosphatase-like protein n=2 Tax=Ketogulonicigenium robustum TaxID=92947 RepID=A0A1W6P057_9RHOB|nr:protein tyrosine/serine phosphatase-like protein [Ketogulonicigenium robustum]
MRSGLASVIDLRTARERAEAPSPFSSTVGIQDIHIPLFSQLTPADQAMHDDPDFTLGARYQAALTAAAPRFAEVFDAIANAPEGVVVFHCTAGKDRTGMIAALLLSLADVTDENIIADYVRTSTDGALFIQKLGEDALSRGADPRLLATLLATPADAMSGVLKTVSVEFGGAAGYLRAAGLTDATINRAVDRLIGA